MTVEDTYGVYTGQPWGVERNPGALTGKDIF